MKQIELTQGQFALVDDEDFERVNQFKWHANKNKNTFYAERNVTINNTRTTQRMHKFIMGENSKKPHTDHIDGNGLNNQRSNLRQCTNEENCMNRQPRKNCSSDYKGVQLNKLTNKWLAQIKVQGKNIYLGLFGIEEDAGIAYDTAAIKYFGEFSKLNFPKINNIDNIK